MQYKDLYLNENDLKALELLSKKQNKDIDTLINELIVKKGKNENKARLTVRLNEKSIKVLKNQKNATEFVRNKISNALRK